MLVCVNHPDIIEGIRHCTRCGQRFCNDCLVTIDGRLYCGTCKGEHLLDVRSGVDRTVLNLAGPGKRFVALFLDRLIVFVPMYVLFFAALFASAGAGEEPSPWVMLLVVPLVFCMPVYEALMMQHKNGQTLGKMVMKIRVVRPDGSKITAGQAWGRAFMRMILEGCLSFIAYVPAYFTDQKTTIHDMVAQTRVVEIY